MNTKRVVAVFTTTRAEFGLLFPLLMEMGREEKLEYRLFVGGAHLSTAQGHTIDEIYESGIEPTATFKFIEPGNDPAHMAANLARALSSVNRIFEEHEFDLICFVGDRYEQMAVVMNAILYHKPIMHIHGGEKSEGAIDEQLRHMYTKASHLHFAACQEYADNIIRMGENPDHVFNVGALGIDNILNTKLLSKDEIFSELKLDPGIPTTLLTYHPSGAISESLLREHMDMIFETLINRGIQIVVTSPNVESGSEIVLQSILHWTASKQNIIYKDSLGFLRYLSLVKSCAFVIGNSSSGIIEVPYFRIPTINIGDRQKGRIRHPSVLDCIHEPSDIGVAVDKAMSKIFIDSLTNMEYQFGDGSAAARIVKQLKKIEINSGLVNKSLNFPGEK